MATEWDIDGVIEPEGGVEYDTGGVVERDSEAVGEAHTLTMQNSVMESFSALINAKVDHHLTTNPAMLNLYSNEAALKAAMTLLVADAVCRIYGGKVTLTQLVYALYIFIANNMTTAFEAGELQNIFSVKNMDTIFKPEGIDS